MQTDNNLAGGTVIVCLRSDLSVRLAPMSENEEVRIRKDILSYLVRHPDAQDTVEGIVQWWLLEQKAQDALCAAKEVLDSLLANGWLEARIGNDGRDHYRVRAERLGEIRAYIDKQRRVRRIVARCHICISRLHKQGEKT